MNSGVRLSVAIIILVIVLVGLYYASLDDGTSQEVASGGPGETELVIGTVAESTIEPETAMEPVAEPPVEVAVQDSPEVTPAAAEVIPAGAWEPANEVAETDRESLVDPGELVESTEEFAEFDAEFDADLEAELGTDLEGDPAEGPEADGIASASAGDDVDEEPAATPEDQESAPDDSNAELGADADDEDDSSSAVVDFAGDGGVTEGKPGRAAAAPGVGVHRLPISTELSAADQQDAADRLAASGEEVTGPIPAGRHLVWMALPTGVALGNAGAETVTRTGPEGGTWVLVREDLEGSLGLNGKISSAELNTVPSTGAYNILIRIEPGSVDAVVARSRALRTHPVAWVMDGRILGVSRPRTVINGRGNIPLATDEATAEQVASRLMAPIDSIPATIESPASGGTVTSSEGGRPAGPGELPAAEYTLYTVEPGDTPSSIATWWFGNANKVSLILKANPGVDPSRMFPGDVIRLPPKDYELWTVIATPDEGQKRVHIVQSGETLSHIAQAAYGNAARWPKIYEANREMIGDDPTKLRLGMELVIP